MRATLALARRRYRAKDDDDAKTRARCSGETSSVAEALAEQTNVHLLDFATMSLRAYTLAAEEVDGQVQVVDAGSSSRIRGVRGRGAAGDGPRPRFERWA